MSAEVQCTGCPEMIDREHIGEHALCDGCLESVKITLACDVQRKLCTDNKWPHFAPPSGRCSTCGENIYSGDRAVNGTSHITGCQYCSRSWCD